MKRSVAAILALCLLVAVGCKSEPTATTAPPTKAVASPEASNTAGPTSIDTATPSPPSATTAAANPTATTEQAAAETDTPAASVQPPQSTDTVAVQAPTAAATDTPTVSVPAAALVNGRPVPLAEFETQVALAEASFTRQAGLSGAEKEAALAQVRLQVLSWLIDQELINQVAERLHIEITDEQLDGELAKVKGQDPAQFQSWLQENNLTEEGFKAQVESEMLGAEVRNVVTEYIPTTLEQVRVRHILVSSRDQAEEILAQIKSNEDFSRLAKEYSQDLGSRESGGDIGFYPRGVLSPEIDRVVFNMVLGQVSNVIQTSFGYHIVQVLERSAQRAVPESMMLALRQQAFSDWLQAERGRTEIVYLID